MFIKLVGFQKLLVDFFLKKVSSLSPAHHALKMALDALGTFQPAPVDSARGRRGQEPPAQTHSYTQHLTAVRAEHTLSGASSWSVCVFPLLRCFRLSLGSFSLGSEDLERLLFCMKMAFEMEGEAPLRCAVPLRGGGEEAPSPRPSHAPRVWGDREGEPCERTGGLAPGSEGGCTSPSLCRTHVVRR